MLALLLGPGALYGVWLGVGGGRRSVSPAQLRQLLLDDDGGGIAPFGEFSIDASDLVRARDRFRESSARAGACGATLIKPPSRRRGRGRSGRAHLHLLTSRSS